MNNASDTLPSSPTVAERLCSKCGKSFQPKTSWQRSCCTSCRVGEWQSSKLRALLGVKATTLEDALGSMELHHGPALTRYACGGDLLREMIDAPIPLWIREDQESAFRRAFADGWSSAMDG